MKRILIIGATSGIGKEVAMLMAEKGWIVGAAGRNTAGLTAVRACHPERVFTQTLDVNLPDAPRRMLDLAERMGGMDVLLHCSGIGWRNPDLDPVKELDTVRTNAEGFVRMTTAAYDYFRVQCKGQGHIAVISSVAGTRGLGNAPAYSASKRFQSHYMEALEHLARMKHLHIHFTDIRPGFVKTPLIGTQNYPLTMPVELAGRLIVRAIERQRRTVVIDWRYRLVVALWRRIPRWLWVRIQTETL